MKQAAKFELELANTHARIARTHLENADTLNWIKAREEIRLASFQMHVSHAHLLIALAYDSQDLDYKEACITEADDLLTAAQEMGLF